MTDPIHSPSTPSVDQKLATKSDAGRVIDPRPLVTIDADLFREVNVVLNVRLGSGRMSVAEILALSKGSVVVLDQRLEDLVEITFNGVPVARGEIVAVEDSFAIRIVELSPR